jgi:hypothetical protein
MKNITHKVARFLAQESKERELSGSEKEVLKRHLALCNDCSSYFQFHRWLNDVSHRIPTQPNSIDEELRQAIERISSRVGRRRKIRRLVNVVQYSSMLTIAVLIGIFIIPRIRDFILKSNSSLAKPTVECSSSPQIRETVTLTEPTIVQPSPTPTNTPPPLPKFNLGNKVPWSEVRFFPRGESDIIDSEALRLASRSEKHLNLQGIIERTGFSLEDPSYLPPGYQFEDAWYDPELQSMRMCYIGPLIQKIYSHPRLCIQKQQREFQDFVGKSAEIFQTTVDDLYAEFVYGGWLTIGQNGSTREYQWDDRIVPVTTLRFSKAGSFFEVSSMIGCEGPECLDLDDLITIAEALE